MEGHKGSSWTTHSIVVRKECLAYSVTLKKISINEDGESLIIKGENLAQINQADCWANRL